MPPIEFNPIFIPSHKSPSKSNTMREDPSSRARESANAAEKEAQNRIQTATKQAEEAEREMQRQSEIRHDEFVSQTSQQSAHQEASLENQRLKGYEAIREMQKGQQAEINRVRREGERELAKAENYYRDTIYQTQRKGDQQLDELKRTIGRENDFERKSFENNFELTKSENTNRLEINKKEQEERLNTMTQAAQDQYEKIKQNTLTSTENADQKFQENYKNTLKNQSNTISELENRAGETLKDLRLSTSNKLAAYEARQKDPFYKLVDLNADIDETGDAFILTASIPEHEREHLSVAVRGNQIVLSGRRRNEEKLDLAPDHTLSTASYQSYSESFPLALPVEDKLISKRFDGDQLVVYIPKKGRDLSYHSPQKAKPERLRAVRPDFPKNLPIKEG